MLTSDQLGERGHLSSIQRCLLLYNPFRSSVVWKVAATLKPDSHCGSAADEPPDVDSGKQNPYLWTKCNVGSLEVRSRLAAYSPLFTSQSVIGWAENIQAMHRSARVVVGSLGHLRAYEIPQTTLLSCHLKNDTRVSSDKPLSVILGTFVQKRDGVPLCFCIC